MHNEINISVIIPVYNASQSIVFLLDDIKQAHNSKVEYIFVNDGSNDNSEDIIKNFKKNNKNINIKYLKKNNGGVSSARNYGLSKVKGKYVIFVDSDDRLSPNFVKQYYEKIVENKTDLEVFTLNKTISSTNIKVISRISYKTIASKKIYDRNQYLKYIADFKAYGYICSYIFKANLLKNIKFDINLKNSEDLFFILQILFDNPEIKIHVNSEAYYFYFMNSKSISHKDRIKSSLEFVKSINYIASYVALKSPQYYPYFLNLKLNDLKSLSLNCLIYSDKKIFKWAKLEFIKTFKKAKFYSVRQYLKNYLFYITLRLHVEYTYLLKIKAKQAIKKLILNIIH